MELNSDISKVIAELAELGKYLWQKGWAERNAGNISVNITNLCTKDFIQEIEDIPSSHSLDKSYPGIAGNLFMITGTGKRMRDLANEPGLNAMMIRINKDGNAYSHIPLVDSPTTVEPTSELPTHLSIHEQLVLTGAREQALLHTHPDELIALTQIRQFCDESNLNNLLWGMHPETAVFIPSGAGFIPYILPGSEELAQATLRKFESHKVVLWEKHGCLAIGRDVFEAFDMIDTLAKSAGIYFRCKTAGLEPEGLSEEKVGELKALSAKYVK
jgi:rhamnulose-1-phosphate aldolase